MKCEAKSQAISDLAALELPFQSCADTRRAVFAVTLRYLRSTGASDLARQYVKTRNESGMLDV